MAGTNSIMEQLNSSPMAVFVLTSSVIGAIFISVKLFSYVRLLLSLFVLSGQSLQKYGRKGSWALVTGASDGIGKEYAMQLSQWGFNVLLVSRTESKLQALAHEIEANRADCQTKILAMDFAANRDTDYAKLKAMVDALDIAILVNNVGKSHDIPVPFILTPRQEMLDIININCICTLRVTQIVAPGMVQRKRGLILTMGSFAGFLPTPLLATYSGSKAFLQYWSSSLGSELKPHGVDVTLVNSYLVTSAMSKIRRTSAFIPDPRTFVGAALTKLGRSGGSQGFAFSSTPYWGHGLIQWALANFTPATSELIINQNRSMHESIRKRALRKQERDLKKSS